MAYLTFIENPLTESCSNECGRENSPMVTNRIQGGNYTSSHR